MCSQSHENHLKPLTCGGITPCDPHKRQPYCIDDSNLPSLKKEQDCPLEYDYCLLPNDATRNIWLRFLSVQTLYDYLLCQSKTLYDHLLGQLTAFSWAIEHLQVLEPSLAGPTGRSDVHINTCGTAILQKILFLANIEYLDKNLCYSVLSSILCNNQSPVHKDKINFLLIKMYQ